MNKNIIENCLVSLQTDAVMSGYFIQLTKHPVKTICFCSLASKCCVRGECSYIIGESECIILWVNIIEELPHRLCNLFEYAQTSSSTKVLWKISTSFLFWQTPIQDEKVAIENHGSNLMSKFIFTRPVGNLITACIHCFSGIQAYYVPRLVFSHPDLHPLTLLLISVSTPTD